MAGQRGLTAAVRSDDGGKFPFFDLCRYIFERIKSFAFLRFKSMGDMADIKRTSPELLSILSSLYIQRRFITTRRTAFRQMQ